MLHWKTNFILNHKCCQTNEQKNKLQKKWIKFAMKHITLSFISALNQQPGHYTCHTSILQWRIHLLLWKWKYCQTAGLAVCRCTALITERTVKPTMTNSKCYQDSWRPGIPLQLLGVFPFNTETAACNNKVTWSGWVENNASGKQTSDLTACEIKLEEMKTIKMFAMS